MAVFPLELKLRILDELRCISPDALHPTMSLVWPDAIEYIRRAVFQSLVLRSSCHIGHRISNILAFPENLTAHANTIRVWEHGSDVGRITSNSPFYSLLERLQNLHTLTLSGVVYSWIPAPHQMTFESVCAARIVNLDLRSCFFQALDFGRLLVGMRHLKTLSISCLTFLSREGVRQGHPDFPVLHAPKPCLDVLNITIQTPHDNTILELLNDGPRSPISLGALRKLSIVGGYWNGQLQRVVDRTQETLQAIELDSMRARPIFDFTALDSDLSPRLRLEEFHVKFDLREVSYFAKRNVPFDINSVRPFLQDCVESVKTLRFTFVLFNMAYGMKPVDVIPPALGPLLADFPALKLRINLVLDQVEDAAKMEVAALETMKERVPELHRQWFEGGYAPGRLTVSMQCGEDPSIPPL
ncbi:hypothetical protein CYLTODRAFT_492641 [Cylindrobasidium torrendii FP15055 ss-10]|uniref:F-box domain-containing protein n=1 Tax=Cylindrobasidium torrendii FP15055 ss-10 TaxID=1314674 RepID=A0A0D7B492_9AGAR|nr:hypothetical protein CYLTODRAFT_492641 [Cylindrobasidium torrendii FP15055 ss-10]